MSEAPRIINTSAETGSSQSSLWQPDGQGGYVLNTERLNNELLEILRNNVSPYEKGHLAKASLRKKPKDLIEPQDKLPNKINQIDTHHPDTPDPNIETIIKRLKDLKLNELYYLEETILLLKQNLPPGVSLSASPSSFSELPKTGFENRKIK